LDERRHEDALCRAVQAARRLAELVQLAELVGRLAGSELLDPGPGGQLGAGGVGGGQLAQLGQSGGDRRCGGVGVGLGVGRGSGRFHGIS
jgi:hypothetical protein